MYQNMTNTVNLPFYQDFILIKNLNVVQQAVQFTRDVPLDETHLNVVRGLI